MQDEGQDEPQFLALHFPSFAAFSSDGPSSCRRLLRPVVSGHGLSLLWHPSPIPPVARPYMFVIFLERKSSYADGLTAIR